MAKREVLGISARSKRWTEDEGRAVLADWQASGKTIVEYSRSIGVQAQRLFSWRRRLGDTIGGELSFVPVIAAAASDAPRAAMVVSRAGLRIEVHEVDASTAAWVLAVLGGGASQ